MNRIITILFLLPFTLCAQQNAPEWHIGISAKPEVSAMTIQFPDESSDAEYGFNGGLTLGYNMGERLTWETGVYYGVKNINHTQGGLTFGSDIDPESEIIGTSELTTKVQLSDFEIPVQMKYFFYKQFYLRTGLGINFLNERTRESTVNHSDGKITVLESKASAYVDYSATLGVGYMQPIGEKFNFNIEPFIKYYFRDKIIPITHLYNIGLNTSLTMKL